MKHRSDNWCIELDISDGGNRLLSRPMKKLTELIENLFKELQCKQESVGNGHSLKGRLT